MRTRCFLFLGFVLFLALASGVSAEEASQASSLETPAQAAVCGDGEAVDRTTDSDVEPICPVPGEVAPAATCACDCSGITCPATHPNKQEIGGNCRFDSRCNCVGTCKCACFNDLGAKKTGSDQAGACKEF